MHVIKKERKSPPSPNKNETRVVIVVKRVVFALARKSGAADPPNIREYFIPNQNMAGAKNRMLSDTFLSEWPTTPFNKLGISTA